MSDMPRNMRLMSTMVGPSIITNGKCKGHTSINKKGKRHDVSKNVLNNLCRWQPKAEFDDRSEPAPKFCRESVSPFHENWLSCWLHSAVGWLCTPQAAHQVIKKRWGWKGNRVVENEAKGNGIIDPSSTQHRLDINWKMLSTVNGISFSQPKTYWPAGQHQYFWNQEIKERLFAALIQRSASGIFFKDKRKICVPRLS